MRPAARYAVMVLLTLAAMLIYPPDVRRRKNISHPADLRDTVIRSAIRLFDDEESEFKAGLNYQLLKKFSSEMHSVPDIRLSTGEEDWTDSLREGRIDILVAGLGDTLDLRGLSPSRDFEDSTVWLIRAGTEGKLHALNMWLTSTVSSKDYGRLRNSFMKKKLPSGALSPYDAIIKVHADKIGWDWKLVASVIYHESRFKIGVASEKGAIGLMQVVAGKHSAEQLLDPEYNISVGTNYLSKLQKRYSTVAADSLESIKFALAAFNAGEGRIDKCIKFASERGVDASSWDNIVELIPEMDDFSGRQTIAYVDGVLTTWYAWSAGS